MDDKKISEIVAKIVKEVVQGKTQYSEANHHECKCVKNITLKTAKRLIEKVEQQANKQGLKVVIAVANSSGNLIALHAMDDSYIASIDIAINKAYTSVALKMPTSKLAELASVNGSLYGIQFTNNSKIVIFGGGEPLYKNGKIVGSVAVSGGTLEEDTSLGEMAKNIFEEMKI